MRKILEITKYYTAELDVDRFLDDGQLRDEWEDWKEQDDYTDDDIEEFLIEKIYEYGPPEDMYGVSNQHMDDFNVSIYDY